MIQKNNVLGYFQDAYLRARGQRVLFAAFCGKKTVNKLLQFSYDIFLFPWFMKTRSVTKNLKKSKKTLDIYSMI